MKRSIALSKEFCENHSNAKITFVGHSKGGAEAVANAVATNKNAIVFNPATAYLQSYDLPVDDYDGKITSYVVEGEILDTLSHLLGKNIGEEISLTSPYNHDAPNAQGNPAITGALDPWAQAGQYLGSLIANLINSNIEKHDISLIIKILEEGA